MGAVLAERDYEWPVARRYMSPDALAKARLRPIDDQAAPAPGRPPVHALSVSYSPGSIPGSPKPVQHRSMSDTTHPVRHNAPAMTIT